MPKSRSLPASQIRAGRVDVPPGTAVTVEAVAAAVRADAAQLLGRAAAGSLSVGFESVTWSDGSLGCPQPGMMYTQALVPGWRVVVGDGRTSLLVYHASANGAWLLCPAGSTREPLPGAATR
jgi:hypothetical protein